MTGRELICWRAPGKLSNTPGKGYTKDHAIALKPNKEREDGDVGPLSPGFLFKAHGC